MGGGFGSDGLVFPERQYLAEYRGGTGLWLLALTSGSYLERRVFSLKGICSRRVTGFWLLAPLRACMFDNADAKCLDTGALGGRVTRIANIIIRLMGAMVSLPLPRSCRPMKKRAGRFKSAILKCIRDGTK